jgi:hypothetical protein
MAMRKVGWFLGVACALTTGLGCDETKKDAPKPEPAKTAKAEATVASAPQTQETAPSGCKAQGDKAVQLFEVHGDVYGFAGDAAYLYYTTWQLYGSRGDLGKVRKDGQGAQPLTSLKLEPRGLVLDDKAVYYTAGIRLFSMPKEGGKEKTIDDKFSSQSISADDQNIYGVPGDYGPYDRLAKIGKQEGKSTELASAKRPPVKEGVNGYNSIAVDSTGIYVADSGNNRILKFATTKGAPKPLATGVKRPFALNIDETNVYFTLVGGDLMMVPKAGGKTTKLATGLVENARLAADAKGVYAPFAVKDQGPEINKVAIADTTRKAVASVAESRLVSAMAIDKECVYWVERVDAGKSLIFALAR